MNKFASARRKDDIVIVIYQDNIGQTVKIQSYNKNTTELLGYEAGDLTEQSIDRIFTQKMMTLINTYIDYTDASYDIGSILSKIRDCKIITKDNNNINVKLKIFAAVSERNKLFFELLIRTFTFFDKLNKFREVTIDYDSYNIIPELDIIDHNSIIQELNALQQFHNLNSGESLVGYISLESKTTMDISKLTTIIKAYAGCTREHDLIGHTGGNNLMFMILDCAQQYSDIVINRIFQTISNALSDDKIVKIKHTSISQHHMLVSVNRQKASS